MKKGQYITIRIANNKALQAIECDQKTVSGAKVHRTHLSTSAVRSGK